ncbi:hydantoin racemase [Actinomadura sp. KC06]|uniref:aspartate/glutamate racemase family protein n=1 Tax=Actinomadura sp. KC06 TaxID=2530369 RepID=UPI00104E7B2B|nr:aspartate/glutamate racemase family protein [Actinomadura sp. KC06]TDD39041.1 hydantoin racemase [Actinomadura sp. KC06]
MNRIWFQKHTVVGRNPWLDEGYEQHARDILGDRADVEFHALPPEVYETKMPADHVKYGQLEVFFSWYFAERAVEAERQGYSAYIIGTSQDPGLAAARSLVSIPVVGYGQATFDFLRSQGLRFGIIGFVPALEEPLRQNQTHYGCADLCVGFRYLPEGRTLIEKGLPDDALPVLLEKITSAAEELREAGAQAIVSGEGIPCELLWRAGIRRIAGLPVIDSNGLALATANLQAELLAAGVWSRNTPGYLTDRAPTKEVDRLRTLFAPTITRP